MSGEKQQQQIGRMTDMKVKETEPPKIKLVDTSSCPAPALEPFPIGPGFVPCRAEIQPDGALRVELLIEPLTAARYRTRAGRMDIGRYLWDNVLHRAIVDAVY